MRLYTFTHFMLSSIQQGIQASHAQSNLFLKYQRKNSKEQKALFEWAAAPTMICLTGGNTAGLTELYDKLENLAQFLKLPYADFCEDAESMNGLRTAVAVLVPARIYDTAALMRTRDLEEMSKIPTDLHQAEVDLATLLNEYGLAR